MSDNKVTLDQLDNSAVEAMSSSVGDVSMLSTENKTIVGAITEIVGKKEIANAIGEPLAETDKFTEMSSEINGLLSTFKTNMMNAGVVVESGDKFKALIDKIKGLTEGEGNSGIQYVEGIVTRDITHSKSFNDIDGYSSSGTSYIVLPKLNFEPTLLIAMSNNPSDYYPVVSLISYDYNFNTLSAKSALFSGSVYGDGLSYNFKADELVFLEDSIHLPVYNGNATTFNWCAIGVGEEDTTLRDSLASILENKGVDITEEDDMASLISKVEQSCIVIEKIYLYNRGTENININLSTGNGGQVKNEDHLYIYGVNFNGALTGGGMTFNYTYNPGDKYKYLYLEIAATSGGITFKTTPTTPTIAIGTTGLLRIDLSTYSSFSSFSIATTGTVKIYEMYVANN